MSGLEKIDLMRVPEHIAIIMDGNGRWAKDKGKLRVFGHWQGVESVRDTIEGAVEAGVKYLTLFAFSTENWVRPPFEVETLMEILVSTISKETATLMKNNIKLTAFGDLDSLPARCHKELNAAVNKTGHNDKLTVNLALSYGARWELIQAVKAIAEKVKRGEMLESDIDESLIDSFLCTSGMPDPELLIRTSGEHRVSNFLLWQLAYSELYFTNKFWPDFRRGDLFEAIVDYQHRERRFGYTGEQLNPPSDKIITHL